MHQGFWEGRRDKHYLLQAKGKQWSSKSRISQTGNREKNLLLLDHVVLESCMLAIRILEIITILGLKDSVKALLILLETY